MKIICLLLLLVTMPLAAETKVLAICGSTREESYNKQLLQEAAALATEKGATVTLVDLKDFPMPFYDADLEKEGMPEHAKRLQEMMIASDAIMIASPEYNSSVSGVLKNAIDWASRSEKGSTRSAFKGKKVAIMSTSPGSNGGSRGLVHLRQIIDDVGGKGTVIERQVALPKGHIYFASKERPVNLQLAQVIDQLLDSRP